MKSPKGIRICSGWMVIPRQNPDKVHRRQRCGRRMDVILTIAVVGVIVVGFLLLITAKFCTRG